jgi:hypothetical protein
MSTPMNRRTVFSVLLAGAGVSLLAAGRASAATARDASASSLGDASVPASPRDAGAAGVTAEIMVLHARQVPGAGLIDPQIGALPQLQKPPFSSYNTYKLLDRKSVTLTRSAPVSQTLVNKRVLQVTLHDITADKRYKVAAAINQPNGEAFLKLLEVTAAPNDTFFVAGQSFDGGILVIGITLRV